MTHINPGAGTTINSVVIDDSKRERKNQNRCIHSRVCRFRFVSDPDCDGLVSGDSTKERRCSSFTTHTPAHPPEAQRRVDAAIKGLYKARGAGTFEEIDNHIDEAIALLQAGRK